jgi:Ca2+-binding RTX toxin-like protein
VSDYLQDAALVLNGFASNQAISLYRYYRRLITPEGQTVAYSDAERSLLLQLNAPPLGLTRLPFFFSDLALLGALDADTGLGKLQPGEQLVVTGHSLGGHLALLFRRMFPLVTEAVYTYNGAGIAAWAEPRLLAAGLGGASAPVVNIIGANGLSMTAAFGTKPGTTYRVFNEPGGPIYNHSIVPLTDSLALYETIGALSPGLAGRIDEVSSILAAASRKSSETLESTLDMLRKALLGDGSHTLIAAANADQAQRNNYYTRLFDLRDSMGGVDWQIASLAGLPAAELKSLAAADRAVRYALAELMPFSVGGRTADPALELLSDDWLAARADFFLKLLEARTADRASLPSGSARNAIFIDVDRNERVALLNPSVLGTAISAESADDTLATYLSGLTYAEKTIFGPQAGGTIEGSAGRDRLFGGPANDVLRGGTGDDLLDGGDGNDVLDGGAGDDVLIGGQGQNVLDGGAGYDTYVLESGTRNWIIDSDGRGEMILDGMALSGGFREADGSFVGPGDGHSYVFSAALGSRGTLTIDGLITVEDFANGELGISLAESPAGPQDVERIYFGDLLDSFTDDDLFQIGGTPAPGLHDILDSPYEGNVMFVAGAGNDWVAHSVFGNDTLLLGEDEDLGFGGSGDDWIEGGPGFDWLAGGRGDDVIYAESPEVDIQIPQEDPEEVVFLHRDYLSGGPGDDVLIGSGRADFLEGGPGNDLIVAGAGDDVIYGDGWTMARSGFDTSNVSSTTYVHRFHSFGPYEQFRPGEASVLTAYLDSEQAGDDAIYAGAGNDYVFAGGGNDVVYGETGNDELHGGDGDDELYGGDGQDRLFGDAGNDLLAGGDGPDLLHGGDGDDRLFGGADDDVLFGDAGADLLDAGPGLDELWVGDGDTIVFGPGDGEDEVIAEGDYPASLTVDFQEGIYADELLVLRTDTGFSIRTTRDAAAVIAGDAEGMNFEGALSEWGGLAFRFSDGAEWDYAAVAANALDADAFFAEVATARTFGADGDDFLSGSPAAERFDGGAGDDHYLLHAGGGRDTISDEAGFDTLELAGVDSGDASVRSDGRNYLLRYPGGEVRLVGQADAGIGIDEVRFSATGETWSRAELASRAVPLAAGAPLDALVARPGEAFRFELPAGLFADANPLGDATYAAATFEGDVLPAWLSFDAEAGVLSGTPAQSDAGPAALLLAMQDASGVAAVAPLVIDVQGSADSGPETPTEEASAPAAAVIAAETPAAQAVESASSGEPAVVNPRREAANSPAPASADEGPSVLSESAPRDAERPTQIGQIQDPVYHQIGDLLFAPATQHASSFVERYAEAVREFRERQREREESITPPPTDEEMGRYNEALHAWLDQDAKRLASVQPDEAWDFGGAAPRYFGAGSGMERLLGLSEDAFARPGLAALKPIQAQPGLGEGFAKLSG